MELASSLRKQPMELASSSQSESLIQPGRSRRTRNYEAPPHDWRHVALGGLICTCILILVALLGLYLTQESAGMQPGHPPFGDEPLVLEHDYLGVPRMARARGGLVAADHSTCSQIGADVLEEQGSAVDAAVATALCLGVVRAANGSVEAINAREQAPAAAHAHMFNGTSPLSSQDGGLAIAAPLELQGLELAWKRHGRLPWLRLVAPAAALARSGFLAYPQLVRTLSTPAVFNALKRFPRAASLFLKREGRGGGAGNWRPPRVGEHCCRQLQLASTLDDVSVYGAQWLFGSAERLAGMAREIKEAGGILTAADMRAARPMVETPVRMQAGRYELIMPPPPSSSVVMGLAFRVLEGLAASQAPQPPPSQPAANATTGSNATNSSADELLFTHQLVESMKHAFGTRLALGDPGTAGAPHANITEAMRALQDPAFADALRALIRTGARLGLHEYGGSLNPLRPGAGGATPDDHGTTHISVVDAEGNAVGLTSTINTEFGSKVVSPSTGILFNNQMDDFSRPDTPNSYGLHPSEANYIAGGKRPLSSMSPTIVTQDGALRVVVGASGGPRILSSTLQTLARLLLRGRPLLAAVSEPRMHHQLLPNVLRYESYRSGAVSLRVDNSTLAYLQAQGDVLEAVGTDLGVAQAIMIDAVTGTRVGVSDVRKDGAPAAARARGKGHRRRLYPFLQTPAG